MPWRRVACLHLPLRAASELEKRVRDYKDRHAPFRPDPEFGWRLNYWSEMLASGKIEREWAANAYAPDGTLDIFGRPAPTIRDDRLVRYLRRADSVSEGDAAAGGAAVGDAGARGAEAALRQRQVAGRHRRAAARRAGQAHVTTERGVAA